MGEPIVQMNAVDGIWVRMMIFKKGDIHVGHLHNYNHITLLSSGSLKITVEGKTDVFKAPCMIFIHKDNQHELEALEENTVASCINALRDNSTNDILDGLIIPQGVRIKPMTAKE